MSSSPSAYLPAGERQAIFSSGVVLPWQGLAPRFLEGLTAPDLKAVLAAATERRFPAGAVVTTQGAHADHLFLLTTGRARYFFITEEGRKLILLWLPPGEMFGGVALSLKPSRYLVSTETVQPSHMLVWRRATIRNLAARNPRLTENALAIASDYLSIYIATHVALTCHTARQRLATLLANLAWGFGRKVQGGIELDVTNEDLANAANVSHFTASRLLSEWNRDGILAKERGKVLLRSPEMLFCRSA